MKFKSIVLVLLMMFYGWCSKAHAQPQETRVALVIGNSNYKNSPLKNPVNDARDMAVKLRGLGFTVIERDNLVVKQIGGTLREFRSKLTPGSVALVYYAGHGLQIKGDNYFPTVDADITGEEDVPNQSLAMKQIMDVLVDSKTRLNLVFLDACRDNPYARSFRSASRGLSKETAPSGTLISFATRPGSVASDGDGRNGLYTGALLKAMDNKNQPIEQVLKRVVSSVKAYSKNQQEPWMEGSIEGEFCFGDCTSTVQVSVSDERVLWDSVKDSRDVNDLMAYVNKFPKGLFVEIAINRINLIKQFGSAQVVTNTLIPDKNASNEKTQSNSGTMEAETRKFLRRYFSDWSADDEKARSLLIESLADNVFFYGVNTSKNEITKEKFAAIKRWSTRNYQEREKSTEIICNYERKFCSVRGVVDWTVSSQTRNARSSGVSEFELGLDYASGRLKIVQENGRTLTRAN